MLLNVVKLLALTLLLADRSSVASKSVLSKDENIDPVDTRNRLQIEKREDHQKLQKYTKLKKSIPSPLDAFDKSGNPKVWTSFDHMHPLKRSEGSILDSVSNPLFQNKVGEFNMSNASANYPINLMYANNLTVKNYFLMMPPCNGSSGEIAAEQMQILGEGLESKDKTEHSVKPHHQSTPGANVSSSYTKEAHEVSKGTVSSTETASVSNVTNSTNGTTVSLNVMSSNDSSSRFSLSSVSSSTETMTLIDHNKTESLTKHVAVSSKTTMNSSVSITSMANEKKEETVATTHRLETTSSKSVLGETSATGSHSTLTQLETLAPLVSLNLSTPLTSNSSSTQNTMTTLDAKASKFLQTVDKYCETFSWSDRGAANTIRPVTFSQHENIDNVLPGKSRYKGKLSSLKDKRFLVQKIPQKNLKQILTDQVDYPL